MSYNLIEISAADSHVFELYKFSRNNASWYYTSADVDIVHLGDVYISTPITRDNINQTTETSRDPINVKLPFDLNFIQDYVASPPTVVTTCTIFRGHYGDAEVLTIYIGRVVNAKFSEQDASLRIESVFSSLKRPCLRFRYQRNCPHDLYGADGCRVDKSEHAVSATAVVESSTSITCSEIASFPDGYFEGGYINFDNSGFETNRFILSQVGGLLTYDLPFSDIVTGSTVTVYPGCDRTLTTCHSKFNNLDNYGGQPFYPEKNPFTGDMIF